MGTCEVGGAASPNEDRCAGVTTACTDPAVRPWIGWSSYEWLTSSKCHGFALAKADCQAAAAELGIQFHPTDVPRGQDFPRGCFMYNNKLYYKPYPDMWDVPGAWDGGLDPDARQHAPSLCWRSKYKELSSSRFEVVTASKCHGNKITNKQDCEAAATLLGLGAVGDTPSNQHFPEGCFTYNNKVYYKASSTGGSDRDCSTSASCLCKRHCWQKLEHRSVHGSYVRASGVTLADCKQRCEDGSHGWAGCIGFTRSRNVAPEAEHNCWFADAAAELKIGKYDRELDGNEGNGMWEYVLQASTLDQDGERLCHPSATPLRPSTRTRASSPGRGPVHHDGGSVRLRRRYAAPQPTCESLRLMYLHGVPQVTASTTSLRRRSIRPATDSPSPRARRSAAPPPTARRSPSRWTPLASACSRSRAAPSARSTRTRGSPSPSDCETAPSTPGIA